MTVLRGNNQPIVGCAVGFRNGCDDTIRTQRGRRKVKTRKHATLGAHSRISLSLLSFILSHLFSSSKESKSHWETFRESIYCELQKFDIPVQKLFKHGHMHKNNSSNLLFQLKKTLPSTICMRKLLVSVREQCVKKFAMLCSFFNLHSLWQCTKCCIANC